MARAFIGLGSNVGDRRGHLENALRGLAELGRVISGSPVYETAPIGYTDQDRFENAVVGIDTNLSPQRLFDAMLDLERANGRVRESKWGPRTLDLDLLWYDGVVIDEDGLTVPHPRIRERRFVVAPLVYTAPDIGDADGPYAQSLADVADQDSVMVTGPVDRANLRWRTGLAAALDLEGSNGAYSVLLDGDWQNRNEAMFGGYLGAAALAAGGAEAPNMVPTSLTYRYLKPVPAGGRAAITVEENRRTDRSADFSMAVWANDVEVGRAHLSVVVDRGQTITSAKRPEVIPIHECVPVDEIIDASGGEPGNSVRSWRPLERWDVPDLVDGSSGMLRAWCPNVVEGSNDPYLTAASLFMPIDALIWPVTMLGAGRLGGKPIFTPTVEISARFAETEDLGGWLLGEARIDHMSTKSVAGSIQVWAEDGRHAATGISLNLTIG